jgi:hypothetical protein
MTVIANNVIRIPADIKENFFRYWLEILKPFHGLTEREMDVFSELLRHRHLLKEKVKDDAILDHIILGDEYRKKIIEDLGVSISHYTVMVSKFRRRHLIVDDRINARFIPNIKEEDGAFKLLFLFDLSSKK